MKLLITGIPGTGKTSIGNYLQEQKGFEHFDMEAYGKNGGSDFYEAVDRFMSSPNPQKVITWGFMPGIEDEKVKHLQSLGYKMIWFDGDRESALRECYKRGDMDEQAFHNQMEKIRRMNMSEFEPVVINTIDEKGVFLTKEAITEKIFKECK